MIDKRLRELVNLLIYGGSFIGLCAACMTALSFEIAGKTIGHFHYILLIGTATAALYCGHRVIGIHKMEHIQSTERFSVIRKYKQHIWFYFMVWSALTLILFLWHADAHLFFWLLPGGIIGVLYILPVFPNGKRMRDLGWAKIVFIGLSWGWLTAFIPFMYFLKASPQLSIIHGLERSMFIILLTIPFEIRDMAIDRSVDLVNLAEKMGQRQVIRLGRMLVILVAFLAAFSSFHYINPAYAISMAAISGLTYTLFSRSYHTRDDYLFSGLIDGMMILVLILFLLLKALL